ELRTLIDTLVTKHPLPLLLLLQLLQPLHFCQRYHGISEQDIDEYEEMREEFFGTGPPRPFTKKKFERFYIIEPGRPFHESNYCRDVIMEKNVHFRLKCVTEHYFVLSNFTQMQKICSSVFVPCKNGVRKCNRSKNIIHGVYCKFTGGTIMPDCNYITYERQGFVLVTCRWQNDIQQLIPNSINDIVSPSSELTELD
uniref:Inactive ribonuclease-like protein 9 n=1 Tax=Sciurus vulgaris TaxID=55149 RepID=A0A8D2CKT7_SCIVU